MNGEGSRENNEEMPPKPITSISKPSFPDSNSGEQNSDVTYPDLSEQFRHLGIDQPLIRGHNKNVSPRRKGSSPGPSHARATFASPESSDPRLTRDKHGKIAELNKMVKYGASYYKILGLEDFAGQDEVARAWRKRSADFHEDKNGFPGNKECMDRVNEAYEALNVSYKKAAYDRDLKRRNREKKTHTEDPYEPGESYANNAWGRAGDEDPDLRKHQYFDDEPDAPPHRDIRKPDTGIRELHERAAAHVKTLISSTDKNKRNSARGHIEDINKEITKKNKKNKVPEDAYTIKVDMVVITSKDIRSIESYLRNGKNMNRTADTLSQGTIQNFTNLCKLPENQWPDDWVDFVRASISEVYQSAGRDFSGNARQPPGGSDSRIGTSWWLPNRRVVTDYEGDVEMVDDISVTSGDTRSSPATKHSPVGKRLASKYRTEKVISSPPRPLRPQSGRVAAMPKRTTIQLANIVEPGCTSRGEPILGFRPRLGFRKDGTPWGVTFVVLVGGKNPIEYRSGSAVGLATRDAYFEQPSDQQNEIKQEGKLHHKYELGGIFGYACYPNPDRQTVPDGTIWYWLKDGTQVIASLKLFREWLGKDTADLAISEFYFKSKLALPYSPPLTGGSQRLLGWRDDYYDRWYPKKGFRAPRWKDYNGKVYSDGFSDIETSAEGDYSSGSDHSDNVEYDTKGRNSLWRRTGRSSLRNHGNERRGNFQGKSRYNMRNTMPEHRRHA
jgi:curved DNA-binding protein CbpA